MPGHPDDDLLADLAADVLPADQARAVEAHVLACGRCAGLLEDAERVRGLLLADDPGPVPADVWSRIEAALAAEGAGASAPVTDRGADTAAFRAFVDAPAAPPAAPLTAVPDLPDAADDEPGPGWSDDGDPLDDPVRWSGGRGPRSAPAARGATRRDSRTSGPRRRGPVLLAAAAAVGVVAVVGAVRIAGQNGSGTATFSAGGAADAESSAPASGGGAPSPAAAAAAPIVSSGRAYRAGTLADQAAALLEQTSRLVGGQAAQAPAPNQAPSGGGTARARTLTPDPSSGDVRNPARLAACLDALGVAGDRLVAVDLATFDGREAAILLLVPAEGGGHEVWAVERSCSEGAEGALMYTRLTR